jgi:hypothetical protein
LGKEQKMSVKSAMAKAGLEYVFSFTRMAGSEAGRRFSGRKKTSEYKKEESVSKIIEDIKAGIDLLSSDIDIEAMDRNISYLGGLIESIGGICALTFVCYNTVPIIVGGGAYAVLGASLSGTAYTLANGGVLAFGVRFAGKKMSARGKQEGEEDVANHSDENVADMEESEPQECDESIRDGNPEL